MAEATDKTDKQAVDWLSIEKHYRAGIFPLRKIADEYGVTEGAIRKRAKRDGWSRDPSAKIKANSVDRSVAVEEADDFSRSGYVYGVFIEVNGKRFYKVGLARQPDVRAAAHQTSLPFEARIGIAYFVPNMRAEERALHVMFASKRIRGEWFGLDDSDLDAMAMRARLA